MHAKFLKRGAHRRSDSGIPPPRPGVSKVEARDIVNPLLNGPVTLTVTVVRGSTGNTPIVPLSDDDDEPTIVPLPPAQTTPTLTTAVPPSAVPVPFAASTTGLNTAPAQSPVLSIITSTVPTTTATNSDSANPNSSSASLSPSASNSVDASAAEDNGAASINLSSGAVAGIVIGCLFVLVAATVFGLRKRSTKNRLKLRGMWANSKVLKLGKGGDGSGFGIIGARGGLTPTPYIYQPPEETGGATEGPRGLEGAGENRMSYVGGRPVTATLAGAGMDSGARNPASARSVSTLILDMPQAFPGAYGYTESVSSPLRSATAGEVGNTVVVARTFIPSLPDELTVSTGEILEVIETFDDGWAECANRNGDIGMVPLECFDRASFVSRGLGSTKLASSPVTINESGMNTREVGSRNSRRYTSLPNARR